MDDERGDSSWQLATRRRQRRLRTVPFGIVGFQRTVNIGVSHVNGIRIVGAADQRQHEFSVTGSGAFGHFAIDCPGDEFFEGLTLLGRPDLGSPQQLGR